MSDRDRTVAALHAAGFDLTDAERAVDPRLRDGGAKLEDWLHAAAQLAFAAQALQNTRTPAFPKRVYARPYIGGIRDGSLRMSGPCHVCGELTIREYAVSDAQEIDRIAYDEWRWKPACRAHAPQEEI